MYCRTRQTSRPRWAALSMMAALLAVLALAVTTTAQDQPKEAAKPEAKPAPAGPQEMQIVGTLVDARTFTQVDDKATWTTEQIAKNLGAGVPALIVAGNKAFYVGRAADAAGVDLIASANTSVKVAGKLHRKAGVQYLEISAIEPAPQATAAPAAAESKPAE